MDDKNKYNNALEKLQEALAPKNGREISGLTRGCIESIFPELVENEDEKIRKALIDFFSRGAENEQTNGVFDKDILAWVEKQESIDENKIIKRIKIDVATSLINYINANSKGMYLSDIECEDIEDAIINNKWYKVYNYMKKELEKQEEKPQGKTAFEAVKEEKIDNANKIEQNSAWNEEDEKNLKRAIWYVENPALNVVKDTMLSEWLKSIKERIDYKKKLIDIIDKAAEWWLIHDSYSKDTNNLVNDFKKDLLKYVNISE